MYNRNCSNAMSWLGIALFTRVNFFVDVLINMVCELKLLHGLNKNVKNFHGDPTFRLRVINGKQCYTDMKYIVEQGNTAISV